MPIARSAKFELELAVLICKGTRDFYGKQLSYREITDTLFLIFIMQFNFLVRRVLLAILFLALACSAQATFLPWQVEQSSVQADPQTSAAKDQAAAEQGTSSSTNSSSAFLGKDPAPTESKKKTK